MRAACATPYKGIVRGLWEGHCFTDRGCIAHASLREDTWIHYYLLMDFTANNNQTIANGEAPYFGYTVPIISPLPREVCM